MELGIRLHLAGLSLSDTILELEKFGVERSWKAAHNWVQKADLQPASDATPDHVALDETVIRINGQQFWLWATSTRTKRIPARETLFMTTTTALTQQFLRELREKHGIVNVVFLVDLAHHLATALHPVGLRFHPVRQGNRTAVERFFREIKRHTSSFSDNFRHVKSETAETWLQAFAVWWNSLN